MDGEDDMPRARPEFVHLSEADVWEAMGGAGGAIEAEVTRLVAQFTMRLMACDEQQGRDADRGMLRIDVRCPIERVAVLMMAEGGANVFTLQ